MLRLYNTLTRTIEEFRPLDPPNVGLYACGLTVYNYAHIGNLRTYIFEDILKRALTMEGYTVKHVMNVTDVGHLTSDADTGDDKMAKGAEREGKTAEEIAEFYWQHFRKDLRNLNILEPDEWPKATETIPEQIELVRRLEENGFTYRIDDGVYFDTSKLSDYGKLARLDVEGLQAGARIDMVEGKRRPTDFALWKFTPPGVKRAMEWDSPWGRGFPGWHIECTAMAMMHFREELDIHCGGIDHIPVHHTNEIAQAEAVTGKQWVRWWMHGAFLVMGSGKDGGRMSKSSGEFITLDTVIDRLAPRLRRQGPAGKRGHAAARRNAAMAYRYFCLNAHYRSPLAFSWEALDGAARGYDRLRNRHQELREYGRRAEPLWNEIGRFRDAVRDDLNMPKALAVVWDVLRSNEISPPEAVGTVEEMDLVLGLGLRKGGLLVGHSILPDEVRSEVLRRLRARLAKDFASADRIRVELSNKGFVLEDTPRGTRVRMGDEVEVVPYPID